MRSLKIKTSYEVAFSPDGLTVLALGRDISLWSINDRKKQWRVHPFSHPSNGTFSPDGKSIAIKNTAGQIVVLDAATGVTEFDFKNQSEGEGSNVCFSPLGDQLIDGSWDGLLTVRSRCSKEILFRTQFLGEMVTRIHKSNTGDFFISEHHPKATTYDKPPGNCYFLKWTWPIGSVEPKRIPFNAPFVKSSALHPTGRCMVVVYGAPQNKMVLFDLSGGDIRWIQEVQFGGSGSSLKWSHCGQFVGAVQGDRIAVYYFKDGALIESRGLPYPSDVDFSPDTSLIAFGSWQEGFVEDFALKDRIAGGGCRVTEKFKCEK
jgi:WD40 repeat protein